MLNIMNNLFVDIEFFHLLIFGNLIPIHDENNVCKL